MKKLLLSTLFCIQGFASSELKMDSNKIYILDFFASWCPSCEKELPVLSKVYPDLKQRGIELIGIDVDTKIEDGKKFQEKMKKYLPFEVINDTSNKIINEYKPKGMPALIVIKNNKVCGKVFGAVANLEEKIEEQIKLCEENKR
ncbi:MAG: TlpA family protein disulfide reductase [Epsilonproteobacteria bacterium]|nr:TlpA family protein disulfide reductase [Campylobacterota bacterium]